MRTVSEQPKLCNFSNPHEYLNCLFLYKKHRNKNYSLKAWSQQLGYKNPSLLSDILREKRRISLDFTERLAKNQNFAPKERQLFRLLCLIHYADNMEQKQIYQDQINELQGDIDFHLVDLDNFRFIEDWYHIAILELVDHHDFREDYDFISARLGGEVNTKIIEFSIQRLLRMGLVKRDPNGKLTRVHEDVYVGKNIPAKSIRSHHKQFIGKAVEAMETMGVDQRKIIGSTLSFKKEDLERVNSLIDKFHQELHKIAQPDGDEVYRVNSQLFPLTKPLTMEVK